MIGGRFGEETPERSLSNDDILQRPYVVNVTGNTSGVSIMNSQQDNSGFRIGPGTYAINTEVQLESRRGYNSVNSFSTQDSSNTIFYTPPWMREYTPNPAQITLSNTSLDSFDYRAFIRGAAAREIVRAVRDGAYLADARNSAREELLLVYPEHREEIESIFSSMQEDALLRDE